MRPRRSRPLTSPVLALALAATLAVGAGAPAQASSLLSDLLFAPTRDPEYVPQTYGTQYDCRIATERYGRDGVWRGLIGGRKQVGIRVLQDSREGCFRTEAECRAFLTYMSGYFLQVFTSSCRKGA